MRKVLLTGANGYIGSHLVRAILEKGYELTTLTRAPFPIDNTGNKVVVDYDVSALKDVLVGQDVVIHLAAMAHQPRAESPEGKAQLKKINVDNALSLAFAAKQSGVKRFVFISSIKAMGESTAENPFRNDTEPRPEDAYGRSKWEAEQGLHAILDESNTGLVVIRPPLVWGGVMKGNLALLQKLILWGIPLPFKGIGNKRDLVSLDNICDLICRVIEHPNASGNTFLVSDGISRSTAQIVQLIAPSGTSPKLFSLPDGILKAVIDLPILGRSIAKLTGTLEVDIEHTQRVLQWSPKGPPSSVNKLLLTQTNRSC